MTRYILKRLGLTVITLVIVSFVVFAASQLLPGDVGRTILGPYASQQQVDALDKSLGNDKPLPVRYWNWASDFVKGDWGVSPVQNVEVRPLVLGRLKNSLYLAAFAMVLIVPFSIFMGIVAALNYGKTADRAISIISIGAVRARQLLFTVDGDVLGGTLEKDKVALQLSDGQTMAAPLDYAPLSEQMRTALVGRLGQIQ